MESSSSRVYLGTVQPGQWEASMSGKILGWIDRHIDLIFNLPTALTLLLIIGYPVVYVVSLSFTEWYMLSGDEPARFVGLQNYLQLFSDERFVRSIWHTFYFAGASVTVQVILGIALALLFDREFRGKTFYRSLFLMPMIAMPTAMSLVWIIMFDVNYGVLNYFLGLLGLGPVEWVVNPRYVIPSLVLTDVWHWTPFMTLLILAGLQSLPPEPFEAAKIDGASGLQTLFFITLPLIKPHIIVAVILRSIFALKTFDTIITITQGGPDFASETMNLNIYYNAFFYFRMGYAAAMGVFFFLVLLVINLILIRLRRREWSY